jgi:glutamyl-tRNA synthetase
MRNRVRFAPSPTGYLHLGNARMAVLNNFLAKKVGGDYIFRIDDTDLGRVKEEYVEGAREDLKWLGIDWVEEFRQSHRIDLYNDFLEKLKKEGRVYACYESKEELEYAKKLQLAKGKPPIYNRAMLDISDEQKAEYEKQGRKPYYRLKIEHKEIRWNDLIKGEIVFRGENISDPVVVREDGSFLYIITSVLDDIEKNITHIIRGEDHVVNTAVQIQMFEYLGAKLPEFAHLPLITTKEGEGFSKRDGALSLRKLRAEGITALAINNYLFALGMGEQNKVYTSVDEIVKDFDLHKYNGAAAKFDEEKLLKVNLHILQHMPFNEIQSMIKKYLNLDINEFFWEIIKHNIENFKDIKSWYEICYGNINIETSNKELAKILLETMPQEDFNEDTWGVWFNSIKVKTPLKGKDLFKPLRILISGVDHGPELKHLIMLIGKDQLLKRLGK